ncbi:hypothetical protein SETIT_1G093500v2 [Setaria italica]|uniref:Uncharacterized protein n=1 Tax=Setaria italica TaxID=4555 RepID=A0A368PIT2_SETIT|nr:hypothetical protein SETIT_1G093500v2 [Setaria italica]
MRYRPPGRLARHRPPPDPRLRRGPPASRRLPSVMGPGRPVPPRAHEDPSSGAPRAALPGISATRAPSVACRARAGAFSPAGKVTPPPSPAIHQIQRPPSAPLHTDTSEQVVQPRATSKSAMPPPGLPHERRGVAVTAAPHRHELKSEGVSAKHVTGEIMPLRYYMVVKVVSFQSIHASDASSDGGQWRRDKTNAMAIFPLLSFLKYN